jgi:hypothetical protein
VRPLPVFFFPTCEILEIRQHARRFRGMKMASETRVRTRVVGTHSTDVHGHRSTFVVNHNAGRIARRRTIEHMSAIAYFHPPSRDQNFTAHCASARANPHVILARRQELSAQVALVRRWQTRFKVAECRSALPWNLRARELTYHSSRLGRDSQSPTGQLSRRALARHVTGAVYAGVRDVSLSARAAIKRARHLITIERAGCRADSMLAQRSDGRADGQRRVN